MDSNKHHRRRVVDWIRAIAIAAFLASFVGMPAVADDLDAVAQDAIQGGVLTLYGEGEFMSLTASDQADVLLSIWIALSARNASLQRIELVRSTDSVPLLEYDMASGLTTATPVETQ